ncbi:MAG: SOS response-associated peptidase [Bacteroidetes bacterium]|nr:SOS response-associated peptidase [Bacteroidota bacterium]
MCGRFQLSVQGKQISERFNVEVFDELYSPNYNCAPSQKLPVITNDQPNTLSYFQWGLIPFWAKDAKEGFRNINTRSETISSKPSFKNAFKKRRCLIPSNGFYEWKKDSNKTPFRIFLVDEKIFAMAGIWETWKDSEARIINSFSIITTSANSLVADIHNRMPVILNPEDEQAWLFENDEMLLQKMLLPYASGSMNAYPVSKKVNSPKNNNPEITLRDEGGQQALFD